PFVAYANMSPRISAYSFACCNPSPADRLSDLASTTPRVISRVNRRRKSENFFLRRRGLPPGTMIRPSVNGVCSLKKCLLPSQPAASSLGRTSVRQVSASFMLEFPLHDYTDSLS